LYLSSCTFITLNVKPNITARIVKAGPNKTKAASSTAKVVLKDIFLNATVKDSVSAISIEKNSKVTISIEFSLMNPKYENKIKNINVAKYIVRR